MNPAEQATHRTKTARLETRLAHVELVLDTLARFVSEWQPYVDGKIALHSTTLAALTFRPPSDAPPSETDAPAAHISPAETDAAV